MRDRIREEADKNGRSMNAEIVAALEVMYPPKSIDVAMLTEFLEAASGYDDPEEQKEFITTVNRVMAGMKKPWTMTTDGFGVVQFYPYATKDDEKA